MTERNGHTLHPADVPLDTIAMGVLEAYRESVVRKIELLPQLAQAVRVPEDQVFYTWARRQCPQTGRISDAGWSYFFHGLECNLRHTDGRFLRIDFGPGGRLDTFNEGGVLQFIMTSRDPWPEYGELKRYFADREPPYDEYSGSWDRIVAVSDALQARGLFQQADQELVAFQERFATIGPDGLRYIQFPQETPDKLLIECEVAHRTVLSPAGIRLMERHMATQPA